MVNTRILIIDDSIIVRKVAGDALASEPGFEVVGRAANGSIGLQMVAQLNPDIVVLDVEMPGDDGLTVLTKIRKTHPKLPVIMFSTLTALGAKITIEALSLGASDYAQKPSQTKDQMEAGGFVRKTLGPKIRALVRQPAAAGATPIVAPAVSKPLNIRPSVGGPIDIVAIGISTGGPNALATIFPQFPANFPVPVVLVQHMPPMFTKSLADRLNLKSNLTVAEATEGQELKAGQAWVAPGDYHLVLERRGSNIVTKLNQAPAENSCRPAVDVLFRSVVELYGSRCLGVIMTGMGSDGLKGCEAIRQAGGQVIVQDEASSVVWGMPGHVANAGLAQKVLPLDQIVSEIMDRLRIAGRLARTA